MKKPKIELIPYEGFAVIKSNGQYLDNDVTGEAYEEMIDALLEAHLTLKNCLYNGQKAGTEIATMPDKANALERIESALKKAGCNERS